MAKIQIYVSDSTYKEIEQQMINHRGEGGKNESLSSFASMLLELGLRVYNAQRERVDDPFDQDLFNKMLLENTLITSYTMSKILGMNSYNEEIKSMPSFELKSMVHDVKLRVSNDIMMVFPNKNTNDDV